MSDLEARFDELKSRLPSRDREDPLTQLIFLTRDLLEAMKKHKCKPTERDLTDSEDGSPDETEFYEYRLPTVEKSLKRAEDRELELKEHLPKFPFRDDRLESKINHVEERISILKTVLATRRLLEVH